MQERCRTRADGMTVFLDAVLPAQDLPSAAACRKCQALEAAYGSSGLPSPEPFLFPLLQTLARLARHGCCSLPGSPCSASPSPWDGPSRPRLRIADRLNPESVDSIAVVYINSHADPTRELRTELPDMCAPDVGRSLPPKGTNRRLRLPRNGIGDAGACSAGSRSPAVSGTVGV